jgi:hypothetical protein
VLDWALKPEDAVMLQAISPLVQTLSLFLVTAVATHLVMSLGQTLIHYRVAHHPIGGRIFRNHINFHHTHYCDGHLVSRTYLGDEGNTTPYVLIPVFMVGACAYFLLPLSLFVVMVAAGAASSTPISFSIRNITPRNRGFSGLHGLGASKSCTLFITDTRTAILQ